MRNLDFVRHGNSSQTFSDLLGSNDDLLYHACKPRYQSNKYRCSSLQVKYLIV